MTQEEFKARMFNALIAEITPKLERLPHVKEGEAFKVTNPVRFVPQKNNRLFTYCKINNPKNHFPLSHIYVFVFSLLLLDL